MSTLFDNINLLDGTGTSPIPAQAVLVSGNVITWVGPSVSAPPADSVIDLGARTLLPGLINSHVHLANDGAANLAAQVAGDSIVIASLRASVNAELTLRSGVTTVKDCGAANNVVIDLAKAVDAGLVVGPRIRAAGRVITMTGGHGYFMGVEADGRDAVRQAVRGQLKAGADFIKAMATGGVLTPGVKPTQTALLPDELAVVVEEAHHAGKRVSTHAIGRGGIENAIKAGADTIEHGFHLDEELFALAIERGTFLVPTLLAVYGIVRDGAEGGTPQWIIDKAQSEAERSQRMFKAAVDSGMRIAAGTDAGTPFNAHDAFIDELILMVSIGLSPLRTLLSATRDAAENADMLGEVGTIEVGKCADFIVTDGDPSTNIEALRQLVMVVKDGVIHRDDLQLAPSLQLKAVSA